MKGLIVKDKWAELILNNDKRLEVRRSRTSIRGTIGIIKSGTKKVWGTTNLYDCIQLTESLYYELRDYHKIDLSYEELLKKYKKPYGWFLKDSKRLEKPIPYNHKLGCVIWVNLDEGEY